MKKLYAVRRLFSSLRAFLLDTVYPKGAVCSVCGAFSDGRILCPACRRSLEQDGWSHAWDWRDLEPGLRAYSLRLHDGIPRSLVLSLKHQANAAAAKELASLIQPVPASVSFPPDTVITWVPMPENRRRDRCVDHGRCLAEAAAAQLGFPCMPLMVRTSGGRRQATLNRAGRERNLKGAFAPLRPVHTPVLLVDDVLTTGTTARRCAAVLRQAGAPEISVLTFTRSKYI